MFCIWRNFIGSGTPGLDDLPFEPFENPSNLRTVGDPDLYDRSTHQMHTLLADGETWWIKVA